MRRGAALERLTGLEHVLFLLALRVERVPDNPVCEAPPVLLANQRRDRPAKEPGHERAIEELELVVAGDERLSQREVDVLLTREIHGSQTVHRVRNPTRPDLDPNLPQHAAESDDVPDDRGALHGPTTSSPWRVPLR